MTIMTAKKSQGVALPSGPAFRSKAETSVDTLSNPWTVAVPADVEDGDVLVMILASGMYRILTAITGWTNVTGSPLESGGFDTRLWVMTKVAASEPASYVASYNNVADGMGIILAYTGVDVATPTAGANSLAFTSTATPTAPNVTPAVDNCLVLAIYGMDRGAAGTTWTPPSGYEERVDIHANDPANGSYETVHVAELLQTTAAAVAPQATATVADEGVAFTVALRPA